MAGFTIGRGKALPKVGLLRITEREGGVPSERDLDLNRHDGVQHAALAHEARGQGLTHVQLSARFKPFLGNEATSSAHLSA